MTTQQNTTPYARVWQQAFLAVLRESGNVRLACDAAQIERSTAYDLRNSDKAFAAAWQSALEEAADLLEAEAWRRAYAGWDEPVYGRLPGKDAGEGQVGIVRRYSDSLMQTLLKGYLPGKYNPTVETAHSGAIKIEYVNDWRTKPEAEE